VAIEGARSGSFAGGDWKDGRVKKLGYIMAWSMVFYHPLEHVAWAQWTMPKLMPRVDGNRLSAWSCRFWVVYIFADLVSSILKNRELEERRLKLKLVKGGHGEGGGDGDELKEKEIEKSMLMNKLQIVRCAFFTGPCISWSLDDWATNPWLTENVCNGLSLAEAVTCMYQSLCSLRN